MALPAGVTKLGSFKGAKGDKGDKGLTGTIASASASSVPADASATVTMTGPETARHAEFEIPRGLPGVNAVENDTAVAAYLASEDAESGKVLHATIDAAVVKGANVSRFIKRAQAGEDLKIVALGDSVLEGNTVTNTSTDGTMKLLPVDLAARFPGTFTSSNRATSGFTAAVSFILGRVNSAITDDGDLYIISFGKNDGVWETAAPAARPTAGYPRTSSLAMVELMCRLIRTKVPKADIIVMATNPYRPLGGAANLELEAYAEGARRVAATYGAEFVDAYTPFTLLSAPDLLAAIPDGVHPGTVGHRLMADIILEHLTDAYRGPSVSPGAPSQYGLYSPESIDINTILSGWTRLISPISFGSGTWVNGGAGWSGSSGAWVNSTAGGYFEVTFNGTELLASLSTAAVDALRATVTVDGVVTVSDHDFTQGKQSVGASVPLAVGLTPGVHTVRVTITSGTLRLVDIGWLEAGYAKSPGPEVVFTEIDKGLGVGPTVITAGTDILVSKPVTLPSGWNKAALVLAGHVRAYLTGDTTTIRTIEVSLRVGGVVVQKWQGTIPPGTPGAAIQRAIPFTISHIREQSSSATIQLDIRLVSTDKTQASWGEWTLRAVQQRIA